MELNYTLSNLESKLFGFVVLHTHCQITPSGFLPANKFNFPMPVNITNIIFSQKVVKREFFKEG